MSGDAMRATLQAQPTSEGDEKSTPALANSPEPQKLNFEQPRADRGEGLQDALPSDEAGGGNAERGRRAMSADGPPPEGFSRA
jgi:hypothetical protein